METSNVLSVELVFLFLLLFVAVFGTLARKFQIPYPIMLVIGGGLLGFLPATPKATLNPDAVFFVVLPPLLYYAAWQTSWRDFRQNLVNISLLAFGLVAFTVAGVAATAAYLFPGFDWKIGLILGAVIAPTDALAATTIARKVGLPKRISDILEGESLVNDASGLLALEFGIAIALRGQIPTFAGGFLRFIYLSLAGVAVGLITAWIVDWIERHIDDAPIEIAISILVPYFAYFTADRLHASGVLAVVACGLYLSRRSSAFFSPGVRLQAWAVWDALNFILNGLVFVLIGLQLPLVLAADTRLQLADPLPVRSALQRLSHCTAHDLVVSRRLPCVCHPSPASAPSRGLANAARNPGSGLDRNARCHCPGCGNSSASDPGRWQPVSAA